MTRVGLIALAIALAPGCQCAGVAMSPDLERMISQPRCEPYEETALFADGRCLRTPPPGTIPRERRLGPPLLVAGQDGERDATRIPLPVTRALVELGRRRFEVVCAACHGIAGDGDSPVAQAMNRVKPPSLHDPRIAALTPGQLYRRISLGWGLMPSAAPLLSLEERWAVVAYLRALQLSQAAPLGALPPAVRAEWQRSTQWR